MTSPNINTSQVEAGYYWLINHKTGTTSRVAFGSDTVSRDVRTTSSVNTPGFRKLKKAQRPINNYSYSVVEERDPLFVTTERYVTGVDDLTREYHRSCNGSWCNAGGQFTGTDVTADDPTQKVVGKLLEEIRLAKASASVTLAEAHKTAAFVGQTATKIVKALRALRRLDFGNFTTALGLTTEDWQRRRFYRNAKRDFDPKATKAYDLVATKQSLKGFVERTWLEYSYAWKPMLKDVYDLSLALSETVNAPNGDYTRYVKAREKSSVHRFWRKPDNYQEYQQDIEHKRWVEIGLWYKVPQGALNRAAAFGLTNPLEVAWELVPFSFVADWFLPVGDALRALTATDGLQFAGGWKTTKSSKVVRREWIGKGIPVQSGSVRQWYTGHGYYQRSTFDFNRTYLQTWPSYGFPQWKDPRSFAHAASAIALLSSLFIGRADKGMDLDKASPGYKKLAKTLKFRL